jgi:hypothetical protein
VVDESWPRAVRVSRSRTYVSRMARATAGHASDLATGTADRGLSSSGQRHTDADNHNSKSSIHASQHNSAKPGATTTTHYQPERRTSSSNHTGARAAKIPTMGRHRRQSTTAARISNIMNAILRVLTSLWFMRSQHITREQGVQLAQAHDALRAAERQRADVDLLAEEAWRAMGGGQ